MDDQHFLDIRNATKRFQAPDGETVTALDDLTLAVRNNEFITLLGPSGCGKTTLLRTISGFEDLDSGVISIDGQTVERMPPHKRPVNTVFQSYALFPHMSVGDNVGYSLSVAKVDKAERVRRVGEALELVGLGHLERRSPRHLSGGQQQRVALARAIVSRPKLLLLDEPLSALDRNLRQSMQLELKTLQHELGISFVFVTHDQEEALTMSDRIVVLDGGRIQQMGTPTEIYDHPVSPFVARFIGESNLFAATVTAAPIDGGLVTLSSDHGLVLRARSAGILAPNTRVTLMIRPERLTLAPPGGNEANGTRLQAKVRQTVFVGSDYQVVADLPGDRTVRALVRAEDRALIGRLVPGTAIDLWYDHASPHLIPGAPAMTRDAAA